MVQVGNMLGEGNNKSPEKKDTVSTTDPTNQEVAEQDSYNEDEDEDYDPDAKTNIDEQEEDDIEGIKPSGSTKGLESALDDIDETGIDYLHIQLDTSQVQTRRQKLMHAESSQSRFIGKHETDLVGIVRALHVPFDVDSLFDELKSGVYTPTEPIIDTPQVSTAIKIAPAITKIMSRDEPSTITINSSFTFAGKLVSQTKVVKVNSAEAKAYLNSLNDINTTGKPDRTHRSYVTVVRKIQGTDIEAPLRIKLKRPSIVDKFSANSHGGRFQKLLTLEKSRLDWASFVDEVQLKDDLAIHNRGGYLEKQSFLDRLQFKRDTEFKKAQEADRAQHRQLEKV